jgi:BolA protein
MSVEARIRSKVLQQLQPDHWQLDNESHLHAGPRTDSHFKLVVVSAAFVGLSKVQRHQRLYQLLKDELAGPVHALALHLYTPGEWDTASVPASPDCEKKH